MLRILEVRLDSSTYENAAATVLNWAEEGGSRYVIAANVHVVMEAHDSKAFRSIVNGADLVVPDGMPLVWAMRILGLRAATRVYGPRLMLYICELAAKRDVAVGLYGATSESLFDLATFLNSQFPALKIKCSISPPFRPLTKNEDEAFTRQIADSDAQILFVGLGCPKQERWMASHKGSIPGVMLGVGAAFDFHSGRVPQAPKWLQSVGLEWLFRLATEPRRLWKRYLKHNPRFVALFLRQLVRERILQLRQLSVDEEKSP